MAAGEGEARPKEDASLLGTRGDFALSCSNSFVTVGGPSFTGFNGRTKSKLLELRWLLIL